MPVQTAMRHWGLTRRALAAARDDPNVLAYGAYVLAYFGGALALERVSPTLCRRLLPVLAMTARAPEAAIWRPG
jgi:hypothetical protein